MKYVNGFGREPQIPQVTENWFENERVTTHSLKTHNLSLSLSPSPSLSLYIYIYIHEALSKGSENLKLLNSVQQIINSKKNNSC